MSNHKVLLAPLLVATLKAGLLALNPSMMIGNAQGHSKIHFLVEKISTLYRNRNICSSIIRILSWILNGFKEKKILELNVESEHCSKYIDLVNSPFIEYKSTILNPSTKGKK